MSALVMAAGIARLAEDTEFDPSVVSPGVIGFIATAVVGLGVIFLGFDLVRRVRRSRYREEIRVKLEAELAEVAAAGSGSGSGSASDTGSGAGSVNTESSEGSESAATTESVERSEIDGGDTDSKP